MRRAMSSRQGGAITCTPIGRAGRGLHWHRNDRQANEGNRLRVQPDIRPHRHFNAVQHEILLADQWRDTRRRGGEDRVHAIEQRQDALPVQPAELLRLDDHRCRDKGAGDQPVADVGIEVLRPLAQAIEVQRRALGRGDDISGRPGNRRPPGWSPCGTHQAPPPPRRPPPGPPATHPRGNSRPPRRSEDRRRCYPAAGRPARRADRRRTGSAGSYPCIASYAAARSPTERHSGPRWSRLETNGNEPARVRRP